MTAIGLRPATAAFVSESAGPPELIRLEVADEAAPFIADGRAPHAAPRLDGAR